MKILFIVPGSGDSFYCGNCFRDNLHATSLRKAGQEVVVTPLYLPLDENYFRADTPLFFPAISLYVSQKFFPKKNMPRWLERMLNSKRSLRMAASFSGATSSEGLEGMTLSMINGDDFVFRKHAAALISWIQEHERPDLVHLSSSLLLGIAKMLKQESRLPVVCSLQDEEIWINPLGRYAALAWKGIGENLRFVDSFVCSSDYYKAASLQRFPEIADRIRVVYPGPDLERYASNDYPPVPTLGFFYRMNAQSGLQILAEAFLKVKQSGQVPSLRLRIGGGFSGTDKNFLRRLKKSLRDYNKDVDWLPAYSLGDHADFYRQSSAVCVPLTFDEGVGLYVCEAFAAGRPVIEPASGSFPEIVGGGGILYAHNDSKLLAEAIISLFSDEGRWEKCREEALRLAASRYNSQVQSQQLAGIYQNLLEVLKR
ncbi:MAG: glycosyltransferase family 4 protein [Tannerellaceae bacterium]|jgi:glycosyltransferase involved in cell wall biosynthesis|nr:glycosyltransferase family 4 protein [Tannerellaceae bacterium]